MLGHALSWPFVRLQIWRAPGAVELTGAAVLVANHISHFDPLYLMIGFDRTIDWMTTKEFYANRLVAAWLRAVNTFPVDRSRPDRRALRLGVERLRAGRVVGVFPEGGIRAGATSILGRFTQERRNGARTLGGRSDHSEHRFWHGSPLREGQLAARSAAHSNLGDNRCAVSGFGFERRGS